VAAQNDPDERVSAGEVVRPLLAVGAIAVIVTLALLGGTQSDTRPALDWRLGLMFLGCTLAVIAFQAFFNQYFALKRQKRVLLAALDHDQDLDKRLLQALSDRTGIPVNPPDKTDQHRPSDPPLA
jgi:hypothetical protein